MIFGLDKCRIGSIQKERWLEHTAYEVEASQETVTGVGEDELYRYLGYLQARGVDDKISKQETLRKYLPRLRCLLRTKLSARNMTKAINTYATSVLTYSFGVLRWTDAELDTIDAISKAFKKYRNFQNTIDTTLSFSRCTILLSKALTEIPT